MRLKYNYEIMELENHIIAVPNGDDVDAYRGVIKLNETGAIIFDQLKQETSAEAIAEVLAKEYEAPLDEIISDVKMYIAEFDKRGLLT